MGSAELLTFTDDLGNEQYLDADWNIDIWSI